jgi:UDP-N-acetylmuramyl pentapeptide synthase
MNFNELAGVIDIKETNVNNDFDFDFFRTHRFETDETKYRNMLYFLSYSTKEEEGNEWCDHFDLRENADKRIRNVSNATFVIENEQKSYLSENTKYIIVENIRDAIDQLYQYKISKNKAQVIGITGSVGKTTCTGLIEQLLKRKYKILRIYSSRITPIVLKGHLLNYLNDDIQFIIMEYSIYSKNHVENLVDMLSPNIAVVLNITTEHLGKQGLDAYEDIVEGKLKIFKNSNVNFLPKQFAEFASSYQNIRYYDISNCVEENDSFNYEGILFKPFLITDLSLQQYVIAIKIAFELGFSKDEIQEQINNFIPVERRFLYFEISNKPIIFVGETVHNSRLSSISDNKAKNKTLIIRKLGAKSTFTDANSLIESHYCPTKNQISHKIAYNYLILCLR